MSKQKRLRFYQELLQSGDWASLETAHVLTQKDPWLHTQVHWRMLKLALCERNLQEILGQIPRVILAAPSSFFNFAPLGNIGSTKMKINQKAEIPQSLIDFLED